MAGFASKGYSDVLLGATAALAAEICHYPQIPVRHARGGVGPGIESHLGAGKAGGGHSDPSTEPDWVTDSSTLSEANTQKGSIRTISNLANTPSAGLRHRATWGLRPNCRRRRWLNPTKISGARPRNSTCGSAHNRRIHRCGAIRFFRRQAHGPDSTGPSARSELLSPPKALASA